MKSEGAVCKKYKNIYARRAKPGEEVQTITADGLETINRAGANDFVVKNQTGAGEVYVMDKKKFTDRYVFFKRGDDGFDEYLPKGKIIALELTTGVLQQLGLPDEFVFEAPWGEPMVAKKGDYIACPPGGSEAYRIARKEFFETYQPDTEGPDSAANFAILDCFKCKNS